MKHLNSSRKIIAAMLCLISLVSFNSCSAKSRAEAGAPAVEPLSSPELPQPLPSQQAAAVQPYAVFSLRNDLLELTVCDEDAAPLPASMPVLRARPKAITAKMARRMASAVFQGAPLYEYSEELSREEILEKIALWEEGVTDEAIYEAHGADAPQDWIDSVREERLAILEYYRNAYANARDEVTPIPCQWKFWPVEHYTAYGHDYAGSDASYTDEFPFGLSVDLRARATVDGIPYVFWASNYEREDFRNHSLSIFIDEPQALFSGELSEEEKNARRAEWNTAVGRYSPAPATAQELEAALVSAEMLVSDMGLGEFRFSAQAADFTQMPGGGWQIRLEGLPVYEGFPVNKLNPYSSSDFYNEVLTLFMTNDGTLIRLDYSSPLEIVELVEASAPLLAPEQAARIAEDTMQGWDYRALLWSYDSSSSIWDLIHAEVSQASLAIDTVSLGYTRTALDSTDYLLIPSLSFSGEAEIIGTSPDFSEPLDLLLISGDYGRRSFLTLDLRSGELLVS